MISRRTISIAKVTRKKRGGQKCPVNTSALRLSVSRALCAGPKPWVLHPFPRLPGEFQFLSVPLQGVPPTQRCCHPLFCVCFQSSRRGHCHRHRCAIVVLVFCAALGRAPQALSTCSRRIKRPTMGRLQASVCLRHADPPTVTSLRSPRAALRFGRCSSVISGVLSSLRWL